jgi:hypothetical protein
MKTQKQTKSNSARKEDITINDVSSSILHWLDNNYCGHKRRISFELGRMIDASIDAVMSGRTFACYETPQEVKEFGSLLAKTKIFLDRNGEEALDMARAECSPAVLYIIQIEYVPE